MWICINDQFLAATESALPVSNPSFKWGEGLFETIKMVNGKIPLLGFHLERLHAGLALLEIGVNETLKPPALTRQIHELCERNHYSSARIRITVYRAEKKSSNYVIETSPLTPHHISEDSFSLCLYPYARKSIDLFCNLKTTSYLSNVQAYNFASSRGYDEALLLNQDRAVCEGSRTNIFVIRSGRFYTPALDQGCVSGVMRRFVIASIRKAGYRIYETKLHEEDIFSADELFLTNAIMGARGVKKYQDKTCQHAFFDEYCIPLFNTQLLD